MTVSCWYDKG